MKIQLLGIAACVLSLTAFTMQGTQGKEPMAKGAPKGATANQQESPIVFTADMKASLETPASPGKGGGHAKFWLGANHLRYEIDVHDLSGPATMAHIHVGALGMAGPPVYTFDVKSGKNGKLAEGTIDLNAMPMPGISGDSLKVLLSNGKAYVNVHTAMYGKGEIRGQIVKE